MQACTMGGKWGKLLPDLYSTVCSHSALFIWNRWLCRSNPYACTDNYNHVWEQNITKCIWYLKPLHQACFHNSQIRHILHAGNDQYTVYTKTEHKINETSLRTCGTYGPANLNPGLLRVELGLFRVPPCWMCTRPELADGKCTLLLNPFYHAITS
jgi:hypothetical protein